MGGSPTRPQPVVSRPAVGRPTVAGPGERVMLSGRGLVLPRQLPFERWVAIGRQLSAVSTSAAWCLGDWLAYGEKAYTGRYRQAIEQTSLDYQTLRNYAWVARQFAVSRRRDTLSFGHHAEVAALPEPEQDYWLRKAEQHRWPVKQLRHQVRSSLAERSPGQNDPPTLSAKNPNAGRFRRQVPPAGPSVNRRPLVDLHRHLEGAIRASTVLELAQREQHPLASADHPRDALVAGGKLSDLLAYLERVDAAAAVLTREADWTRAAREVVLDAYDEGLDALELRFSPWFVHSRTGLRPEAIIDAVIEGVAEARSLVPLPVGLIGILVRHLGPDSALPQLNCILRRSEHFCAIDIAGDEAGYAARPFAPAFNRAREAGLRLTAHAGEAAGPESVWDAIRHLGAERIGHGVRAAEDPRLMNHLAEHRITLEVSLTSNVQTRSTPSYEEHPLRTMLHNGVPVTLSTDDPRVSSTTLSHEYDLAAALAGLTDDDLTAVAQHSLAASFIGSVQGGISAGA
jgi:adenosine deaminase